MLYHFQTAPGRPDLAILLRGDTQVALMYGQPTLGPQQFIFSHVVTVPGASPHDQDLACRIAEAQNQGRGLSGEAQTIIAQDRRDLSVVCIPGRHTDLTDALDHVIADAHLQGLPVTYELAEPKRIAYSNYLVIFEVQPPDTWRAIRSDDPGRRGTWVNVDTCGVSPLKVVHYLQPPLGSTYSDSLVPNSWDRLRVPYEAAGQRIAIEIVEPVALGAPGQHELAQLLADLLGFGADPVHF